MIENVSVEESNITSTGEKTGGIIGMAEALTHDIMISKCIYSGTVTGDIYTGGIVGYAFAKKESSNITATTLTINKCENKGTVTGRGNTTGGIVGQGMPNSIISNCTNEGVVQGDRAYIGGIVGAGSGSSVQGCANNGTVRGGTECVGGVIGENNDNGTVQACTNTGKIEGSAVNVGGIVGKNVWGSVESCYNTETIEGSNHVGGIAGYSQNPIRWCYNTGNVIATGIETGIAGGIAGRNEGDMNGCYNTGNVEGIGNTGGIAGRVLGSIYDCYNIGAVSGGTLDSTYVGGVIGSLNTEVGLPYTIGNCYFNKSIAGGVQVIGHDSSDNCAKIDNAIGLFTENMTGTSDQGNNISFSTSDSWTFPKNVTDADGEITSYHYPYLTENAGKKPSTTTGTVLANWKMAAQMARPGVDYTVESNNYSIHTAEGLAWFADQVNTGTNFAGKTVTLTANIDLTQANVAGYGADEDDTITEDNSWQPIGIYEDEDNFHSFSGTFDGNGKTISGVYIHSDEVKYQGLFGYVRNGTIQNLGVIHSRITAVDNSQVQAVGGIVSRTQGSCKIEKCYFTGEVSGGIYAGGIVGRADDIIGSGGNITIQQCYNTGSVQGSTGVGGMIGSIHCSVNVSNCYNRGLVKGTDEAYVGGLVGYTDYNSLNSAIVITIQNCYNIGEIQGNSNSAGILGSFRGYESYNRNITECYYNLETSGVSKGFHVEEGTLQGPLEDPLDTLDKGIITEQMTGTVSGTETDKYNDNQMVWDPNIWTFTKNIEDVGKITYTYPVLTENTEEPSPSTTKGISSITLPETLQGECGTSMLTIDDCSIGGREETTENTVAFTYYEDEDCTVEIKEISEMPVGTYYVVAHLESTDLYSAASSNTATIEIVYAEMKDTPHFTIVTSHKEALIINDKGILVYEDEAGSDTLEKCWIDEGITIEPTEDFWIGESVGNSSGRYILLRGSREGAKFIFYTRNKSTGAVSEHSFLYSQDSESPTISFSPSVIDGWTNQDVELTITMLDIAESGSGLDQYRINEDAWVEIPRNINDVYKIRFSTPYTLTENQDLKVEVKDHVGHITEATYTCEAIDRVAPEGTVILKDGDNAEITWDRFIELDDITFDIYRNAAVSYQMKAEDEISGILSTSFYISNKPMTKTELGELSDSGSQTASWTNTSAWNGLGSITSDLMQYMGTDSEQVIIYAKVVDQAGNVTYRCSDGIVFDTLEPKVTATDDCTTDWTKQDITIRLEITETGSGLASVEDKTGVVTWTQDAQDSNIYTTTVSANGTYHYTVTDKAGNITEDSYVMGKIDKESPTITDITAPRTDWHNGKEIISFTPGDKASGVDTIVVTCKEDSTYDNHTTGSFTASVNGTYTITVTDFAGNSASKEVVIDKIDKVLPVISDVKFSTEEYINGDVTLTVEASDSDSGIQAYSFDNGENWQTTNSKVFTLNEEVNILVRDEAGNVSVVYSDKITNIDKVAPTGSITIDTSIWNTLLETITFGIYKAEDLEVQIDSEDEISGIASAEYMVTDTQKTPEDLVGETDWTEYEKFTIKAVDEDKVIVYVKIRDNAGNVTYISSNGMAFDTTVPVITGIIDGTTYCEAQTFSVIDTNIETVTVNGIEIADYTDYELAVGTTYTIVATDKAKNSATVTVTVNDGHSYSYEVSGTRITGECEHCAATEYVELVAPIGNMIYNGKAWETEVKTSDILSQGTPSITYSKVGEDVFVGEPTDIGIYTASIIYGGKSVSVTYEILPATIEVTPDVLDKLYGEVDSVLTYTYSGNVNGETPDFEGVLSRESGEEIGSYPITIGSLTLADTNYVVKFDNTVKYEIKEYTTEAEVADYTEWKSADTFTVEAPEGYSISTSKGAEAEFEDSLEINTTQGKDIEVTYYLRSETGAISTAKTFTYSNDQTAPTGEIIINENVFKTFLNTITFNMFFKKNVDVKIEGADTLSGVAKVEYQKVAKDETYDIDGTWTTGEGFSVTSNEQFSVYARITDKVGLVTDVNSDGVTVYTDSEQKTASISFTRLSTTDVSADVTTNGNTILAITNGSSVLKNTDYSVSAENAQTVTITFKASYLDTLSSGDYTFTIQYKPLGEAYVEPTADSEAPADTEIGVVVSPKSVEAFEVVLSDDSKVYDGEAFKPTVTIEDSENVISSDYYTVIYSDEVTVGTKEVKVIFNEPYTGTLTEEVEITEASIEPTVIATQTATYNSLEQHPIAPTATTVNSQTLTVKYSGNEGETYTLDTIPTYKDAGTYTIYYELSAENHVTSYGTIEFTITPVQLTWNTDGSVADKIYDGTTTAAVATAPTLNGIAEGDTTPEISAGMVTFEGKDVGTYGINVTGYAVAENANYIVPTEQPSFADAKITERPLTITPDVLEKYYGEEDGVLTYTYSGNVTGETPILAGTLEREDGESIGSYAILVDQLDLDDNGAFLADNYQLSVDDTVKYEIKEYTTEAEVENLPKWQSTDTFTVEAPEGYLISLSNGVADTFQKSVDIKTTEGADVEVTYYLRSNSGAISNAKVFLYKNDQIAPTGTIDVNENTWSKFLEVITFGIYESDELQVTITGEDVLSGIDTIEYYVTSTAKTLKELSEYTDWNLYHNSYDIPAQDATQVVVYAKLTDYAGNATYLSSDGVLFDTSAPIISGIENNGFYANDISIEVADTNLELVTLNGQEVESSLDVPYGEDRTYTLVATDKAGNLTTMVFHMYVEKVPVEDVLEHLPTVDENATEEEKEAVKEEIKETVNNLVDAYLEELNKENPTDETVIIDKVNKLEELLVEVNPTIVVVTKDKVIDDGIPSEQSSPEVGIKPQGLAVAIYGSDTFNNHKESDMELSLSVRQTGGSEDALIFDVKPMISIDGKQATIIPNEDLRGPVSFRLYLNDNFQGSIARVEHVKEDGSSAFYEDVAVHQDDLGKYVDLMAYEFSNFIIREYKYEVNVDGEKSEYKVGDTVTIKIPTKDGYEFIGWVSDEVVIVDGIFSMPEQDVVINATWKKVVDEDTNVDGDTDPDADVDVDNDIDSDVNTDAEDDDDIVVPSGDNMNSMLWIVLLGVSLLGFIAMLTLKKKNRFK